MAAGIAVELRILRSLMEDRLRAVRQREREEGKAKKEKNNNENDDDDDQSAAGKRLTDGQTHDEESDKKAPLFEDSKTAFVDPKRPWRDAGGRVGALGAEGTGEERVEEEPVDRAREAEPGAPERDNKRRNKRKREKGKDEDQGKLKNRRSVFNWRWMLAARASQVHTNTPGRNGKAKSQGDGAGWKGGETALVDKGGIIATGRPFSDNTSDNEMMQDYDADDRNRPAERSVGVEGRQLDHSSQATRWA
ncbi:uncharacterized protein ARB_04535 [Trichophyton benhamiae CBS 112371]|uniref:Uncharacterized protein n=1 Tax=Arthroderma benhamiae (strain ATCC MYA-4681 / CBS 112371) TaxID=663331 RepID=D4AJT5_ARTBC|nr:uncharacterized protein ARB_04535 [Trichophyton benhamiae CBS 112371]EFE37008.1 hypothetical protein ARB_04535 [Trichophyton benhamiae CBS 112371]